MTDAVELVKKAAVEAVLAGKPTQITVGTVISARPLGIQGEQKAVYTPKMLLLTRNVTDYSQKVTENGEERAFTVKNALQIGEKVLLLRVQGGKKFAVLDRLGGV